jgi:hypothetical protein
VNLTFEIKEWVMSINAGHAHAVTGSFARSIPQSAPVSYDFGIVCLWSFLGLDLTALAIAFGYGAQIAEILAAAG